MIQPAAATRLIDAESGESPFLKWIGGKRWLIRHGVEVPALAEEATYFEPFVGAGSMYFAIKPKRAVLGDVNRELIWTYRGVKNNLDSVIKRLGATSNSREFYDQIKLVQPTSPIDRATRFIYLNRTAYGGVYRVNRLGVFNVPFGNYTDRNICQEDILRSCSALLQSADIYCQPFEKTVAGAKTGDFVYFDPPYTSKTGSAEEMFNRYNRHIFTWEMHKRLATVAKELSTKGVNVLVSNTAYPDVAALYDGFRMRSVKRKSQLSRDPLLRGYAEEALYSNYSATDRAGREDRSQNR